ncbi:MAG: endolytic transglycosylase MltG [Thermodesulfobacteriota bacterium]
MARDARPKRRKKKTGNPFLWVAGFLLLLVVGAGGSLWLYGHSAGPLTGGDVAVLIPPRSSLAAIEGHLQNARVIHADGRFQWYARLRGVATRLKAGEYVFRAGQTPEEVLRILVAGRGIRHKITIPEGYNIAQIADLVAASGLATRAQFLALARDRQIAARFGIEAETLEGYLFPDTYYFTRNQAPREIVTVMAERGKRVLDEVMAAAPADLGLTPHQVLTLASIVEKETGQPRERPLIARVFLNRLRQGIRLQADPTVIYGIANFNGNITKADLKTRNPYNTYVNSGLPPGPIASPGREAIAAVLNPAPGSHLYFVSRNDGSHHFSATLAEHNRAVANFQPKRPPEPAKKGKR